MEGTVEKLNVVCNEGFRSQYGDETGEAYQIQLNKCKECIENAQLIVATTLDQFTQLAETPLTQNFGQHLRDQLSELKPHIDKAAVVMEGVFELDRRTRAALEETAGASRADIANY